MLTGGRGLIDPIRTEPNHTHMKRIWEIPEEHLDVPGHLLRYRPENEGQSYSLALQQKS